MTVKGTPCD